MTTTHSYSSANILWILFLGICLLAGIAYDYSRKHIISPASQYFVTAQYDKLGNIAKASNVLTQKNVHETHNNISVYKSDCNAIHFKTFNYVVLKYRDVSLCNVANVNSDEFVFRTEIFKEKVDSLWQIFYYNHVKTIVYGALKGVIVWLTAYAFASILHSNKGRRRSSPNSHNTNINNKDYVQF